MRLLLDTHGFLWFLNGDPRLPVAWRDLVRDPAHEVFVSVASVWEATIKHQLGRLPLPDPPHLYLPRERQRHRIASLAIDESTIASLATLPLLHRDPFDRILVAQALRHGLTIVTVDPAVRAYSVEVLPLLVP